MNKPHFKVVAGRPVQSNPRPQEGETKLERASRIYGRAFGTHGKTTKGITFWTAERIHELSVANEAHRRARDGTR